jgi:tetratricopeptide (TPR) repeat protein
MADEMFKEAVQAAKSGQRHRAKDLLTRLIKADQENADYWLWMSAVVDTEKEQVFCLQKALKIDPNSIAARRGLVVLGALKPEDAALPPAQALEDIPVEIPELQKGGGVSGFLSRRRNREVLLISGVGLVALIVVAVLVLSIAGLFRPRRQVAAAPTPTATHTPAPTATLTPTSTPVPCTAPAEPNPATPLAVYLCVTQTATTIPIATEPSIAEAYTGMKRAYNDGNWDKIISVGDQVIQLLPDSPRVYFYLAEAYRNKAGDKANDPNLRQALTNYRTAISKDGNFAPAYWGKALAEIVQGGVNDALKDFDSATKADPNFVAAYLDRGIFYEVNGNTPRAVADLEQAKLIAPGNAVVLANLAIAYADSAQAQPALDTAEQAIAIDKGMALAYYARGWAEYGLGQFEDADQDLSLSYLYVKNDPPLFPSLWQATVLYHYGLGKAGVKDDSAALRAFNDVLSLRSSFPLAYLARGQLYLRAQKYDDAHTDFNTAISQFQASDANNLAINEAYLGNGQAWLGLGKPDSAISNFQIVVRNNPDSFEGYLGMGQSQLGTNAAEASVASFTSALEVAQENAQRAQAYSWRAQAYAALGRAADQVADLAALAALGEAANGLAPTAVAKLTQIGPLPTDTPTPLPTGTPTLTSVATATVKATTPAKGSPTPTASATVSPAKASPTANAPPVAAKAGTPTGTPTATRTPTTTRTPSRTP